MRSEGSWRYGRYGFAGAYRLDPCKSADRRSGIFTHSLWIFLAKQADSASVGLWHSRKDSAFEERQRGSRRLTALAPLLQPILEHHRRVEIFDFQITGRHHFEGLLGYQAD